MIRGGRRDRWRAPPRSGNMVSGESARRVRSAYSLKARYQLAFVPSSGDRQVSLRETDVHVILEQLPAEAWTRLQVIHFSNPQTGVRWIGCLNRETRRLTITPLPSGTRRLRFEIHRGPQTPKSRGSRSRRRAPYRRTRVVQDLLFDVDVDETGRLEVVNEQRRYVKASPEDHPNADHADFWRLRLWSFRFADGPQPLDGPEPSEEHLEELTEVCDVTEIDR